MPARAPGLDPRGGPSGARLHAVRPFQSLDGLAGKPVGPRTIAVQRKPTPESLKTCQVAFIGAV